MKYLVIVAGSELGKGLVRLGYYADYETARELAETICRISRKAVKIEPIVVKIESEEIFEIFEPDDEPAEPVDGNEDGDEFIKWNKHKEKGL